MSGPFPDIQPGDLVSVTPDGTTYKIVTDPAGVLGSVTGTFQPITGTVTVSQGDLGPPTLCRVCSKNAYEHLIFDQFNPKAQKHPFCGDNLSYLAWKYESKQQL